MTPCKGVFADVQKNIFEYDLNTIEDFKNIMDDYKRYKTGYRYSAEIGGIV